MHPLVLFFFSLVVCAAAIHIKPHDINSLLLPCYDYIVVGGGVSGLVVANRLTEDPDSEFLPVTCNALSSYLTSEISDCVGHRGWCIVRYRLQLGRHQTLT
jgi:hypothetical protein